MAYRDFSLPQAKKVFGLTETSVCLFSELSGIEPSPWLQETLRHSLKLALAFPGEKARSEFVVTPILIELERRNPGNLSIYSGEILDVDVEKGLKGECDSQRYYTNEVDKVIGLLQAIVDSVQL